MATPNVSIEVAESTGQAFTNARQGDALYYPSIPSQSLLFGAKHNTTAGLAISQSNVKVSTHIIPSSNVTYDLGTPNLRFRDLYMSGNTIYLGDTQLSKVGDSISLGGVDVSKLEQTNTQVTATKRSAVATWTARSVPGGTWKDVCWAPELSLFVAVCPSNGVYCIMTSPDGINWTTRTTPLGHLRCICWAPELMLFVAFGWYVMFTSSDGINWTAGPSPSGDTHVYLVEWSPQLRRFVAIATYKVYTSSDGINWTSITHSFSTSGTHHEWYSLCWSPEVSLFVAAGYMDQNINGIMTSPDGLVWTTRTCQAPDDRYWFNAITWADKLGLFVLVNSRVSEVRRIFTSPDGVNWTTRLHPQTNVFLQTVCWSPELACLVVTGPGTTMLTSFDGNIWTSLTIPNSDWKHITWSSELSMFVGVSETNSVINSLPVLPSTLSTLIVNPAWMTASNNTLNVNGDVNFNGKLMRRGQEFQSGIAGVSNNTDTVFVTSGSNFGIGTSNPLAKVDVIGNVATSGTVRIGPSGAMSNVSVDANLITSGILGVAKGGTGVTASTGMGGSIVLSQNPTLTGTTTIATLNATMLQQGGQPVALSNHTHDASAFTSGVLPLARGGTGVTSSVGTGSTVLSSNATLSNVTFVGTCTVGGHVIPSTSLIYDLGTSNMRFRDLYLSGNTIDLAGVRIGTTANSNVTVAGININKFAPRKRVVAAYANSIVTTWASRTSAADTQWYSVCWSPELSQYVAVSPLGTQRVMTSTNGITWTTRSSPTTQQWLSVCWSSERRRYVAVANAGTNRVMTSSDGITWTASAAAADSTNAWFSVCWSQELKRFVAVANSGTNRAMYSADGLSWTTSTTNANQWECVCWSPELMMFVAVADSGTGNRVMTSSDGIAWTTRTTPVDNSWWSVCWSPELMLFAAVAYAGAVNGSNNRIMTSPDGITWTTRIAPEYQWFSIIWSSELSVFTVVGNTNLIMTSTDGITWTTRTTPSANIWRSVCWSPEHSQFVAVSESGTGNRVMTTLPALPSQQSTLLANPNWMTLNNSNGFLGLSNSNPTERLDVIGNIRATGNITASGDITAFSDARVKTDLQIITDALHKVRQLNGYTYNRVGDDSQRHVGVIAQEVESVLPEVISTHPDGYMSVAYGNMVALLIEALKEVKLTNKDLQDRIMALRSKLM